MSLPRVEVNGRWYRPADGPVVVVCVDGSEPAYHEQAIAAGRMPFFDKLLEDGTSLPAECAMPSFTNPNNLSIATGVPPSEHGICGNYFFDTDSGEEVMMNDPKWLCAPTLFAAYSQAGADVAVITAKDKLRRLLGAGMRGGICFSAEFADRVRADEHGIDDVLGLVGMRQPQVYSAELSELVLAAGVEIVRRDRPDLVYLSLTDYIQHKYAPGSPVANDFYAMLDRYVERLDSLGCTVVVTADHGMNAKTTPDGAVNVVYLQSELDELLGVDSARVILPITDPYTVHHGALGSFATVYLPADADVSAVRHLVAGLTGVDLVLSRDEACDRFELPADRIGDIVVVATRHAALGTTPERHDLSALTEPLRSHGGLTEQHVPFVVNRSVAGMPDGHRVRNYDAYWVAVNFTGPRG